MLDRIAAALKSMVTRGKVTNSRIGPRTLLQITGLDGVTQQVVELLLPPGYSARPVTGADLALLQVLGSGDHVIALGGDTAGQAIADLAPGEFGLSNGTQMIVVRADHIQITSPTYVLVDTPLLKCTGDVLDNCNTQPRTMAGMRAIYDTHTHTGVQTGGGATGLPTNLQ